MTPESTTSERDRLRTQYAEIATLAGGLAHEIKNPLSTISMNLELLIEDAEEAESPRERRMLGKLQTVQRECSRLNTILEDFLRFARAGELHPEEVDLNAVVREFVEFFQLQARGTRIELSPHLAPDLPKVWLDTALFRQAFLNLALNAQQAMPDGGTLEFQTRRLGDRVALDLIDNGNGMSPATLEKIFQVFFSTRPGGSGLGLPTVRKIVEAHHGTITAESAPGKGTRFTIVLPAASAPESAPRERV